MENHNIKIKIIMNKGFTLKSVLIVLGVIVLMILIAFFAQRTEKEPLISEKEAEEDEIVSEEFIISEEFIEFENNNQEEEAIQGNNNNDNVSENNNQQIINFPEIQIIEIDCGEANYLVSRAKQDLALRTNASLQEIKTIGCQENFFSDHTLGTSGPGEVYHQTLTFGYVMTFLINRQEYKYHINNDTILFVN